jgi:hypothetical protein
MYSSIVLLKVAILCIMMSASNIFQMYQSEFTVLCWNIRLMIHLALTAHTPIFMSYSRIGWTEGGFCHFRFVCSEDLLLLKWKYALLVMNSSQGSTSPSCTFFSIQLQNWILCRASVGLSSCTTVTLCWQNFINLVALEAEPTGIPVSCDNRFRDFWGLICNRARMSLSFSSVSTVFLRCYALSSTDPVIRHFS